MATIHPATLHIHIYISRNACSWVGPYPQFLEYLFYKQTILYPMMLNCGHQHNAQGLMI